MTDETQEPEEPELPPYKVEPARSSRSRCRSCKRTIDKDVLRIGILLEGPYGTGYLWHHLKCAAGARWDDVVAAYEAEAWEQGVEPPPLATLEGEREKAEKKKAARKKPPYLELDPSGRAACKCCGERMQKGSVRAVLARKVEFYGQERSAPVNVHLACVGEELAGEECAIDSEGLLEALRESSAGLGEALLEESLAELIELD